MKVLWETEFIISFCLYGYKICYYADISNKSATLYIKASKRYHFDLKNVEILNSIWKKQPNSIPTPKSTQHSHNHNA